MIGDLKRACRRESLRCEHEVVRGGCPRFWIRRIEATIRAIDEARAVLVERVQWLEKRVAAEKGGV